MSRQVQRTRVPPISDNPYQGTTSTTLPLTHTFKNTAQHLPPQDTHFHLKCTGSIRGNPCPLEHDDCFTDEAFTEHNYYDYYDQDDHGYQTSPNKFKDSHTEFTYSDESGSVQIPYYEYDEISNRRHSRNNYSERGGFTRQPPVVDGRGRVYPCETDRVPIPESRAMVEIPQVASSTMNYQRRGHFSRMSNRSQDETPSAVIHGCGGKCQTFENVCYYFLQVAFTMGILIGISLAIAGWVLRKSAARNLQVLLYIGAMLSLVCALLLRIQCNARKSARIKRRILRNGERAHIPMELLPNRTQLPPPQPNLAIDNGITQRGVPVTLVQLPSSSGPVLQVQRCYDRNQLRHTSAGGDQQGIPWWRRKEII